MSNGLNLIFASCVLLLISCGSAEPPTTGTALVIDKAPLDLTQRRPGKQRINAKLADPISGTEATFDGTRVEKFARDTPLANFAIDISLRTGPGNRTGNTDDITPSMPFTSDSVSLYLTDTGYFLHGGVADHVRLEMDTEQYNRIIIVNAEDGAKFILNGQTVWSDTRLKRLSSLKVGAGFAQRVWAGSTTNLQVLHIPDHVTVTDAIDLIAKGEAEPLFSITE